MSMTATKVASIWQPSSTLSASAATTATLYSSLGSEKVTDRLLSFLAKEKGKELPVTID